MTIPVQPIQAPEVILRIPKGSELTYSEVDGNFYNIKNSLTSVSTSLYNFSTEIISDVLSLTGSVSTISANLSTETSIRSTQVSNLQSLIDQEILDRQSADNDINSTVSDIDTRLTTAEGDLVSQETRIDGVETDVSDHETRIDSLELKVVSPFNYRGSVAGGSQASPFDLETLTYKSDGDYYRVSSSGYFVDSLATTHYLNATDSFVFIGGTIEKFDNTDTVVSGGSSYVSVSGSADEGYSVDLAQTTKDSIDSISSISSTVSGHTTQISDIETDVADHETRITTLESTSTSLLYATKASGRASFTTTDPDQIFDSFDSTVLRTAKYVVQAELSDGSMHASEILVTNNGTTVYITEYAKLNGGTDLVTYTADFNGTLVELYATPANTNTTITFARTAIKKA